MITRHDIFNYVDSHVNTTSRPVYMTSRFEPIIEQFPACYLTEISHRDVRQNVNLAFTQNVRSVGWEAQVFSNKRSGALDECHEIIKDVEAAMQELSFIETYCSETPYNDPSIVRIVARFERVICGNDTLPNEEE